MYICRYRKDRKKEREKERERERDYGYTEFGYPRHT